MKTPHLVCVLEGSGEPIFSTHTFDYRLAEGDLFRHTAGGVTTTYKVENAVLEAVS